MKVYRFLSFFVLFAVTSTGYPQSSLAPAAETMDGKERQDQESSCRLIYDENQHLVIPQKGLAILYFYDPRNWESSQMKPLISKFQMANLSPKCFFVDISLSLGLKRTYRIRTLPAMVVLQDKKVIYGMTGFVDDQAVFNQFLEEGIQSHLIVSPEK